MTTTYAGHPVPLDVEAAALVEEFGRVWLVSGFAVCGEDRSPLEPVMTPADRALYVCLTGQHSWGADEVDAEAWRRLLAAGGAAPEDRRRIMAQLSPRWAVEPLTAHGVPPMVLRIHSPATTH